ncbi:NAD(P)H-dependent oxidoreductase [Rhodococcus sp. UNC363MFTsu5.1]|uniref:NAD(P)H-dependent oxidoreductase n=1 Tax=Rhodococcus sp. UNC363MFTsu5.1 TaxID=1449069 RepID=UPI0004872417|nr:NAD(P)H-dependent oxidoreductase [Rhodococcus sp. UNC363MFTsu5.1]
MTNETTRPNVLLVVAHPDRDSATWAIGRAIEQGIETDGNATVTTHDLSRTGFDPVFGEQDLAHYRQTGAVPADVQREQRLVDSADVVAVLFPVYWWAMPALAKGWIDRVFTRGWAYDDGPDGGPSAIDQLHFVGVAAVDEGTYDRRGYRKAMTTQLQHGIAGYSRIDESSVRLLFGAETADPHVHEHLAAEGHKIGADLAQRAQLVFDRDNEA